jgi:arabinofuranosyltransferase
VVISRWIGEFRANVGEGSPWMKRIHYYILHLPVLFVFVISAVYYFNFTAEDAFITYRYAENWVNIGSLVYNQGEPINAMTSPVHAILSAALFLVTGNTVLSNKILALLFLLISALMVWYRFRDHPQWQLLALVLMLMPPSVLLWTVGGLETSILLFLATVIVLLANRYDHFNFRMILAIFFLAGLGLLTRYDSILFFLPIALYVALRARSKKDVLLATAIAVVLPLTWFAFSIFYYGDLLPTSFYVKTPKGNIGELLFNGAYVSFYLLFVGLIPVLALSVYLSRKKHSGINPILEHFKSMAWLYIGLVLELLYGLTIATHHMMFSFRFFIPYLPSAVILVVDLLRRTSERSELDVFSGKSAILFTGFLACLMVFQIFQDVYTYHRSLNGISPIGEYRSIGIPDYVHFIRILKQEAVDIENHWETISGTMNRRPRILTFAAGMLPYTFKDAYIYEKLVSYRHCYQRYQQGLYADYLHILAPRHGQISEQLPKTEDNYSLISSYEMYFDGSIQEFQVYYNPDPEEQNLSARIYEPCQPGEQAQTPISNSTER